MVSIFGNLAEALTSTWSIESNLFRGIFYGMDSWHHFRLLGLQGIILTVSIKGFWRRKWVASEDNSSQYSWPEAKCQKESDHLLFQEWLLPLIKNGRPPWYSLCTSKDCGSFWVLYQALLYTHRLQGYYQHYGGQCNNILNGPNLAASYSWAALAALGKIACECREMESGPHPIAFSATNRKEPLCRLTTVLVHLSPSDKNWPLWITLWA